MDYLTISQHLKDTLQYTIEESKKETEPILSYFNHLLLNLENYNKNNDNIKMFFQKINAIDFFEQYNQIHSIEQQIIPNSLSNLETESKKNISVMEEYICNKNLNKSDSNCDQKNIYELKTENSSNIESNNNVCKQIYDGKQLEESYFQLLKTKFPKMEIKKVGNLPHLTDIHMIDHKYKIFYLIELKQKTIISKTDIEKFKKDTLQFNFEDYKIIGLFISPKSTIPLMGETGIEIESEKILIYLSLNYTTIECISLLTQYLKTLTPIIQKKETITITELSSDVESLLYNLSNQYESLTEEKNKLKKIKKNNLQHNEDIDSILYQHHIKIILIKKIFTYLKRDDIPKDIQENYSNLIQYIKAQPKFKKSELSDLFPEHKAFIQTKTKQELQNFSQDYL